MDVSKIIRKKDRVGKQFKLQKMFTRQGYPDFLDLPWEYHLDDWANKTERIVEVERGRSRHTVVFVHYEKIYAVKELPKKLAKHEYDILRQIEDMELPAVTPVGYATLRDVTNKEVRSIVITEYLKSSLPYRSIFMRSDLIHYQDRLLDALAVLLVTIHLKNIYWGDCSLSNILFKRDAGELQAYLVDAETSEINPTLSTPKRNYDLSIMQENVAGELLDLSQIVSLPEDFDVFEIGQKVQDRYEQLWDVLNSDETIHRSENYKINEKIEEINTLGFSVDEIEITSTGEEDLIQVKPKVTDRNYHQDKFQNLTGFSTEENIARKILAEIYEIKTRLTNEKKREIPLSNAAFYWSNKEFYPIIEDLDQMDDNETALQTYVEILEIKRDISRRESRDVSMDEALNLYKNRLQAKRELHLFKRGFRRTRSMDPDIDEIRELPRDWKERVIYQVYPRSFYDTDANGVGDIPGIIEKLDYLSWLGVDTIRLNSVHPSPMEDMGYDVTYFKGIEPMFGTLEDFDTMVELAHSKDIKIILDLVLNHTSDQHAWFKESRQSKDNPKRNWYIWRPPKDDGGPPNNWLSITGDSAWTYDDTTGEYYLHSFLASEPDLNWRNPDLRGKMLEIIKFWLDHGVDGILFVMLSWMAKDHEFRNDPKNPNYDPKNDIGYNANIPIYSCDRPELVEYVQEIVDIVKSYDNRITLAELDQFSPMESFLEDYSVAKLIDIPLNTRFIEVKWSARAMKNAVDQYEEVLNKSNWPNYVVSTHDFPRLANRIGRKQARTAAMLLLTLRGIPTIYYGEEIGMTNTSLESEQIHDPWEKIARGTGRDRQRSPMQWNNKRNAGFTEGDPWLPISGDHQDVNVNKQTYDESSMLNLYRELLKIRSDFTCLRFGKYQSLSSPEGTMMYIREYRGERVLIVLNFMAKRIHVDLEQYSPDILLLTTCMDQRNVFLVKSYNLREHEGVLILLNGD